MTQGRQGPVTGWIVVGGLVVLVAVVVGLLDERESGPDPEQVAREAWSSIGQQNRDTMCEGMRITPATVRQMLDDRQGIDDAVVDETMKILTEEC